MIESLRFEVMKLMIALLVSVMKTIQFCLTPHPKPTVVTQLETKITPTSTEGLA